MDYTRNSLRATIKAIDDVVTPAVDSTEQAQAMEQIRLAADFLRFVERRIHLIGDRERHQLRGCADLARKLELEAERLDSLKPLRTARQRAEHVISDPHSDSPVCRRATAELESAIRLVVRESADNASEQRRAVETAVLAATSKQIEADRAWLLPLQFDADPESVAPVHTALDISSCDEGEPA